MSTLFETCFFVPTGQIYPECVQQIDQQKLCTKMSSLGQEQQNEIFLLILEYCRVYDLANYGKIMNTINNKKIYLPYSLSTLKNNVHVKGTVANFPPNLLLSINNYCNLVFGNV